MREIEVLANPWRQASGPPAPDSAATAFHAQLEGYMPSELREAPALASDLRVGRVLLKVERERFGLPAFYELHVWAWKANPSGTFADWNPTVSCDDYNADHTMPGGHQ